jgi:tetratricopeptide (TPR) repeat protein
VECSAFQSEIKLFGHDHIDVATSYNNIGIVYGRQSKYDEAFEVHQKALEIRIKVVEELTECHDHIDVAASHLNIGNVYQALGMYDEALAELENCLKVVGRDHMDVAESYVSIGEVHEKQGKYEEALEMHQKALRIQIEAEHMHAHYSHAGIRLVFLHQEIFKSAHEHCQMALKILTNIHKTGHPDVVNIHILLGRVHCAERQYSAATDQYEIARAILDEQPGENNPALSAALQLRMGHFFRLLASSILMLLDAASTWPVCDS